MGCLEVDGDAVRLQDPRERLGDLFANPLLDGEPPSEEPHEAGQLGDADDVLVGDVADVRVAEERKGMVLAERIKGNGPFNHLADLAVGAAVALGGKGGHQLGVALVAFRRVEHGAKITLGGLGRPRGIQGHAQRLEDFGDVAFKPFPVGVADASRPDALPVAIFDILVVKLANPEIEMLFRHQFGCRVCSDTFTSS